MKHGVHNSLCIAACKIQLGDEMLEMRKGFRKTLRGTVSLQNQQLTRPE